MKYIYRMSRQMFFETAVDARNANMTVEKYITATFGLLGECVKVEVV